MSIASAVPHPESTLSRGAEVDKSKRGSVPPGRTASGPGGPLNSGGCLLWDFLGAPASCATLALEEHGTRCRKSQTPNLQRMAAPHSWDFSSYTGLGISEHYPMRCNGAIMTSFHVRCPNLPPSTSADLSRQRTIQSSRKGPMSILPLAAALTIFSSPSESKFVSVTLDPATTAQPFPLAPLPRGGSNIVALLAPSPERVKAARAAAMGFLAPTAAEVCH